jgi:hypothetical protein
MRPDLSGHLMIYQTFDTFTVNNVPGWNVTSLFSNDLQTAVTGDVTTQANWSIRTGRRQPVIPAGSTRSFPRENFPLSESLRLNASVSRGSAS